MSKRILLYFFIFTLSTLIIHSKDLVRLAKIDLNGVEKRNQIETLQLKVIDIDNHNLITLVDKSAQNFLNKHDIQYTFLSNEVTEDALYLVDLGKMSEIVISEDELLYQDGKNLLVKNPDLELRNMMDVKLIPLTKNRSYFKNEKVRFNSVQSDELDQLITSIITEIDPEIVRGYIQGLQDFGTRFLRHPNRKEVSLWIKDQFELMGYTDVVLDSFMVRNYMQYNVVATYPASTNSEKVIVVGGHHDSITNQSLSDINAPAPGADDNASGTTAVLETARAVINSNLESEVTIKFVTFAAEELGLYGAFDYAEKAADSGMDIKFMINHDMISSTGRALENSLVNINYYTGSEGYGDLALANIQKFTEINGTAGSTNSRSSDSHAFYSNGFNVVYFSEYDFSDYYHTEEDLIENYSMEYCAEVIKASAATLIAGSVAPDQIRNFEIADVGDGSTLQLTWNLNEEPDVVSYNIHVGIDEGEYTEEYETSENSYSLTGLTEGQPYYIGISAVDSDGYESLIIERSNVPQSIPRTPSDFSGEPKWHSVELSWSNNVELDLLGYNVYRSELEESNYYKVNEDVLTESSFIDESPESGVYYEYMVRAVDNDQNESEGTETIISRAVTLDRGILLVDETSDGDGTLFKPTDEEVDGFYNSILTSYQKDNFDLINKAKIDLADMGAYSAIIWHGDDKTDQSTKNYTEEIAKYLDFGGKFLYSGYRPSKTFAGITSVTAEFKPGDFLYDYFKLSGINYSLLGKFKGAYDLSNEYVDLTLDPEKIDANGDEHITGIESFVLVDSTSQIYEYYTTYAPSLPQGLLHGEPVGTEYIGEDFSTIILSFPLYYVEQELAAQFIDHVMTHKFGLPTGVEEETKEEIPTQFTLAQNYPNPFNPTTSIEYQVASSEKVSIKVYDVLGREVKTLVNEQKAPGNYNVTFDASELSSGIYFYQINAGEFNQTRKMILMK